MANKAKNDDTNVETVKTKLEKRKIYEYSRVVKKKIGFIHALTS